MMLRALRQAARGVWYALVLYFRPPATPLPPGWEWRQGFMLTSLYDPAGHVRGCVFPLFDREPPGWACWSVYPIGPTAESSDSLPAPTHTGTVQGHNQPTALRSGQAAIEHTLSRAGWVHHTPTRITT